MGRRRAARTLGILLIVLLAAAVTAGTLAFRSLLTDMAVSTAQDAVILAVNSIVEDVMSEEAGPERLVLLERGADGTVAAVTTDVAAVNRLAARVLARAVDETAERRLTVSIPVGNLAGGALLSGKGPSIPVEVVMLSSSTAGFRSELTSAGINQTRHRILLDLDVQMSLFMPWRVVAADVETEILVSETVIVGEVPESYLNWER